jgi:hypothetical protein
MNQPFALFMRACATVVVVLAASAGLTAGEEVMPLPRAHAHNDYEHARPLLDALDQGFTSVEADIFLVDGKLLVAHDRWRVKPERTLEALYLDPLRARVRANGGRVFKDGPPFHLLIDFKTEAAPTWKALSAVLEDYGGMLTRFTSNATHTNAVTIVLSGNSPRELLAVEARRLAAIDGRPPDLESPPSVQLVPWISDSWGNHFTWRGAGEMPAAEREKLRAMVVKAHAQGRRVRLWGAPDVEALWREQFAAGVDLINTDKLAALAAFLRQQ